MQEQPNIPPSQTPSFTDPYSTPYDKYSETLRKMKLHYRSSKNQKQIANDIINMFPQQPSSYYRLLIDYLQSKIGIETLMLQVKKTAADDDISRFLGIVTSAPFIAIYEKTNKLNDVRGYQPQLHQQNSFFQNDLKKLFRGAKIMCELDCLINTIITGDDLSRVVNQLKSTITKTEYQLMSNLINSSQFQQCVAKHRKGQCRSKIFQSDNMQETPKSVINQLFQKKQKIMEMMREINIEQKLCGRLVDLLINQKDIKEQLRKLQDILLVVRFSNLERIIKSQKMKAILESGKPTNKNNQKLQDLEADLLKILAKSDLGQNCAPFCKVLINGEDPRQAVTKFEELLTVTKFKALNRIIEQQHFKDIIDKAKSQRQRVHTQQSKNKLQKKNQAKRGKIEASVRRNIAQLFKKNGLKEDTDVEKLLDIFVSRLSPDDTIKKCEKKWSARQTNILRFSLESPEFNNLISQLKPEQADAEELQIFTKVKAILDGSGIQKDSQAMALKLAGKTGPNGQLNQHDDEMPGQQHQKIKDSQAMALILLRKDKTGPNGQLDQRDNQMQSQQYKKTTGFQAMAQAIVRKDQKGLKRQLEQCEDKMMIQQYQKIKNAVQKAQQLVKTLTSHDNSLNIKEKPQQQINTKKKDKTNCEIKKLEEKLRNIFVQTGIKQDLTELIKCQLQGRRVGPTLQIMQNNLSGNQYDNLIKTICSVQIKEILRQLQKLRESGGPILTEVEKYRDQLKNCFQRSGLKFNANSLIQKLANNQEIETLLTEYQQQMIGQEFSRLKQLLESQEVNSIIKKIKKTRKSFINLGQPEKQVALISLIHQKQIPFEEFHSQFVNLAISKGDMKKLIAEMKQIMGKNFERVHDFTNSKQYQSVVGSDPEQVESPLKEQLDRMFKSADVNEDMTKLIDTIQNQQQIEPILKQFKNKTKGSQYKKINSVVQSERFKEIINRNDGKGQLSPQLNHKREAHRKIIEMFSEKNGKVSFEQLTLALLQKKNPQTIIEGFRKKVNGAELKEIKSIIASERLRQILAEVQMTTQKSCYLKQMNPKEFERIRSLISSSNTLIEAQQINQIKIFELQRVPNYFLSVDQKETLEKEFQTLKENPNAKDYQLTPIDNSKKELSQKLEQIVDQLLKILNNSTAVQANLKNQSQDKKFTEWSLLEQIDALQFQKLSWHQQAMKDDNTENKTIIQGMIKVLELILLKMNDTIGNQLTRQLNQSFNRISNDIKSKGINNNTILSFRNDIRIEKSQSYKRQLQRDLAFIEKYMRCRIELQYIQKRFGLLQDQQKLQRYSEVLNNLGLNWSDVLQKELSQPFINFSAPDITQACKSVIAYFSYLLIKSFLSQNQSLLQNLMTPVYVDEKLIQKIFFGYYATGQQLLETILSNKLIQPSCKNVNIFIKDKKQRKFYLYSQEAQIGQISEVYLYQASLITVNKNNNISEIALSKKLPLNLIKVVVYSHLSKNKVPLAPCEQMTQMDIEVNFGEKHIAHLIETVYMTQKRHMKEVQRLEVHFYGQFRIYYETETIKISMPLRNTCKDLKERIFKEKRVPMESQIILYCPKDIQGEIENQQTFQSLDDETLDLKLVCGINLDHYGFNDNYKIQYHEFRDYYIESEKFMKELIAECDLGIENEQGFFRRVIKFMFAAVKKKFNFDYVINQVRKKIYLKNGQKIWKGKERNFNSTFILYYIMINSDERLKTELINITSSMMPIPMLLRKFRNINAVTDQWVPNEELVWFLHQTFTVASVGIHDNKSGKEKGKTYLFNHLVDTNFELSNGKHPISEGCPEIYLRFLEEKIPINIIDISSLTPVEYKERILKNVDFLVIHSWKSLQQTKNIVEEWKTKYHFKGFMCFLRDQPKQDNVNKFKQQKKETIQYFTLQTLPEKKEDLEFIDPLRDFLWSAIEVAYKLPSPCSRLYNIYDNPVFSDFEKIIQKIEPNLSSMIQVTPEMTKIKNQEKIRSQESIQLVADMKKKVIDKGLHTVLKQIIQYMAQNQKFSEFLLLRLRVTIRDIRQKSERPYGIITSVKQKLMKHLEKRKDIVGSDLRLYLTQMETKINNLKMLSKVDLSHKEISKCVEEINKANHQVINEIKPSMLSIQLFWRELQYLAILNEKETIGQFSLLSAITDIKKRDININQPFEILDGDLLQMPKKFMKKVFDGKEDRVAVISVLGPQSSGKSTLLNFLYGCDFSVSSGRCTKGGYGTYFKFSNMKFKHCHGVFIIDTEGLFAVLTAKEDKNKLKKQFDAKLVLFCLAVSDFVIINTKGNFDGETDKILRSSLSRFEILSQGNSANPELLLVLNQNQDSDKSKMQEEIHKNNDLMGPQNVKCLAQAYQLKQINSKKIKLLKEDECITKKTSRAQFLSQCMEIVDSLMHKINQKDAFKSINQVIDQLEKTWNTIDTFPNLGFNKSKQLIEKEKEMKDWKVKSVDKLNKRKEELYKELQKDLTKSQQSVKLLQASKTQIQNEFQNKFHREDEKSQDILNRIQLEKGQIRTAFESIVYELKCQIADLQKQKLVVICKQQGSDTIEQLIRQTNLRQQNAGIWHSKKQKQPMFDEVYNKILLDTQKNIGVDKQVLHYFKRVKQYYENCMKSSDTKKSTNDPIGLPQADWPCELSNSFENFSNTMKRDLIKNIYGNDRHKYFIYIESWTVTKIVSSQGTYDAKLKYFNMSQYFSKKKTDLYYVLPVCHLDQTLRKDVIKDIIKKQLMDIDTPAYSQIFLALNKYFSKKIGFQMSDLTNFKKTCRFQMKWFTYFEDQMNLSLIADKKQNKKCQQYHSEKQMNQGQMIQENTPQNIQFKSFVSNFIIEKEISKINQEKTSSKNNNCNKYYKIQQSTPEKGILKKSYIIQDNSEKRNILIKQEIFKLENSKQLFFQTIEHEAYQSSSQTQRFYVENLSKKIKKAIDWKGIKTFIEKEDSMDKKIRKINNDISKKLNDDLRKFGISIECEDFYSYFMEVETGVLFKQRKVKDIHFKKLNSFNTPKYPSRKQLENELYKMVYLRGQVIADNTKSKNQNAILNQDFILGFSQQQSIEVGSQYARNNSLKTYLQNSHNHTFFSALSTEHLQNFVFSQLQSSNSFEKLFAEVDRFVMQSPNSLSLKTVQGVFSDVCKQITVFNDDLNQVSYKLTVLFTGYVHLYAVYMIWKKFAENLKIEKNKPFEEMSKDETKNKLFDYYCLKTSKEQGDVIEGQVIKFIDQFKQTLKTQLEQKKKAITDSKINIYKNTYTRQQIQHNLDRKLFDQSNKSNEDNKNKLLLYLTDPKAIIEEQYQSRTDNMSEKLKDDIENLKYAKQVTKEFKQLLNAFLKLLEQQKIDQKTSLNKVVNFEALAPDASLMKPEIQAKAKEYLMKIFIRTICKQEIDQQKYPTFNLKPATKFKMIRNIKPSLQRTLKNIETMIATNKLYITNISKFITVFLNYKREVNEKIINHQGKQQPKLMTYIQILIDKAIKQELNSAQAIKEFCDAVYVKVCPQKCPGCQRICGVQQPHVKGHKCLYGHQMRALGGVKLDTGEASVIRCENVHKLSTINYNKKQMSWQEFQEYWAAKDPGSWNFDDLQKKNDPKEQKLNKQREELFSTAWDLAGQDFCKMHEMKFVKFLKLNQQMANAQMTGLVHYIFALDDSGSMSFRTSLSRNRWQDLMQAFGVAIEEIKKIKGGDKAIKVSILIEGSTCIVNQRDKAPADVSTAINPRMGRNNFADTFQKALVIMEEVVPKETVKFIFMTDGGCTYPAVEVAQIKALQYAHPKKINYYGIEFCNSGDTMKKICLQLKGQNKISYDVTALTNTYVEYINRGEF